MPTNILRRLSLLALLPTMALAQRGGDVGGRGFAMPRVADLEDHKPLAVALDKKKKLALSDSQVTALTDIAKQLKEKNATFYAMWDSTRVTMRAASAGAMGGSLPSAADQERMMTARTHMTAIVRALKENDDWARAEALKVLTDEQKPKAEEFWQTDAEEFGRSMRGPGGGPGGPGGPGGGRPPGA